MDVRKVMREVYKSLKYLSTRQVVIIGILLSASIAVTIDMSLIMANDISAGGIAMIEMIQSWHFWVFSVAVVIAIYSVFMLWRYAGRTEQDLTIQNINSHLGSIEDKLTKLDKLDKLDELIDSVNNLIIEIRNDRQKDE